MPGEQIPEVILKYYQDIKLKKTIVRKDVIIVKRQDGITDTWSKHGGGWLRDKRKQQQLFGGIGSDFKK